MVDASASVPKRQGDESCFMKRAGARRERWKQSSDARPKSRWLPSCKRVTAGKRPLPKPGSQSAVRPPIGCCARCVAVGKLLREDGRHGHPAKLRTAERDWLESYCHMSPGTPSRLVQTAFQERFGIQISIGYLNQVRANLGLGSRIHEAGKKTRGIPTE